MLDSKRQANTAQPSPTGAGAVVLDAAVQKISAMYSNGSIPHGAGALIDDLAARAESGKIKYGTLLRTNNSRDARVDFYQELLDALMYSMQSRMERKTSISNESFEMLASLAARLAVELNER